MEENNNNNRNQSENSEAKGFQEENIVDVEYEATKLVDTTEETNDIFKGAVMLDPIQTDTIVTMPIENIKTSKNKNGKGFKKVMSYVLVGVICSVIGGASAVGAMMYVVPNTSAFKDSDLYEKLSDNNTGNSSKLQPMSTSANGQGLSIADIAKKVGPAVVGVSTKSQISYRSGFGTSKGIQEGMGSGVIFDSKGYIITNYHVIKGAIQIHVILNNNKEVAAKEINHDEANDIAIIQITDKVDLPGVAVLGDSSNIQVGEPAIAIGNPMGELLGSVTTGIISGIDRQIEKQGVKFIQTDAPISPGNSGGPLINAAGQVIGINSEKLVADGAEGLGFAIPINLIKSKVEALIKTPITTSVNPQQSVTGVMIGIGIRDIDQETATQDNKVVGIEVQTVEIASAGDVAGIKEGDIIIKFDGQTVKTAAELNAVKAKKKVGDKVKIIVNRAGKEKELTIKFVPIS